MKESEKMAKVYVETEVLSQNGKDSFQGKALLQENRLIYYQDKIKNTFTYGKIVSLIREDEEVKIELYFSPEPQAFCHLKKYAQSLSLQIEVESCIQEENQYKMVYDIEGERHQIKISIRGDENG